MKLPQTHSQSLHTLGTVAGRIIKQLVVQRELAIGGRRALFGFGTRPRGADVEEGEMPLTKMTGEAILVVANSQVAW